MPNAPDKFRVPAVHDWHLRQVLQDLGLLEGVERGQHQCRICNRAVTLSNLGGILVVAPQAYRLVCEEAECLAVAGRRPSHG
jgi:hypothetical protein